MEVEVMKVKGAGLVYYTSNKPDVPINMEFIW